MPMYIMFLVIDAFRLNFVNDIWNQHHERKKMSYSFRVVLKLFHKKKCNVVFHLITKANNKIF